MADLDVYLSFNGTVIPNNSYIEVDMMGSQDNNSLICCTNNEYCCHGNYTIDNNPLGAWKYPNGSSVAYFNITLGTQHAKSRFGRNRNQGTIRLMRIKEPTERGHFCCEIPDSSDTNQTLCTNIVDEVPTHIDVQPKTQRVCSGQNVTYSIAVYNITLLSYMYQWQRDEKAIDDGVLYSGTTTETLFVKNVSKQHEGIYRCTIRDHIGLVVSDQAPLRVLNRCSE